VAVACAAREAGAVAAEAAAGVLPALDAPTLFACGCELAEAAVDDDEMGVVSDVSVWLMEMSWSSWFSETIWLTIWVGSTGCVGS